MFDPHAYRSLFPITKHWGFFDHAGVSALNTRAVVAMHDLNIALTEQPFLRLYPQVNTTLLDLRTRFMGMVNARSIDEIVLMPNTATGINTAAVSLPLRPGDNVLILDGDYPANVYPWQQLAYRGVLVKTVPTRNGGLDLDLLAARIDNRTRVIALSTVQFSTGFRNDLAAVGAICKERGIFFVVDGIQSMGVLPCDVQAAHIDMLACGSQKWLLGPVGAGFLYVRREVLDVLQPGAYVGAASVVDPMNYLDYNLTLPPTAERFQLGSSNMVGMVGLHASVSLLQEAGIEHVARHVVGLASLAVELLRSHGFEASPHVKPEQRSGIVIAKVPNPMIVQQQLFERGFMCSVRGAGIRIAPHLYNTEDEIRAVVGALRKIVQP